MVKLLASLWATLACIMWLALWDVSAGLAEQTPAVVPFPEWSDAPPIDREEMSQVYDAVKTPYKYGIVLRRAENQSVDCPNVFRHGDKWYMVYVAITDKVGYETFLAVSDNLLDWQPQGKVLAFADAGWDQWQADGSIALVDHQWAGSGTLKSFDGKYWMSYFGGAKRGYETDPLSIGMAWTQKPDEAQSLDPLHRQPRASTG